MERVAFLIFTIVLSINAWLPEVSPLSSPVKLLLAPGVSVISGAELFHGYGNSGELGLSKHLIGVSYCRKGGSSLFSAQRMIAFDLYDETTFTLAGAFQLGGRYSAGVSFSPSVCTLRLLDKRKSSLFICGTFGMHCKFFFIEGDVQLSEITKERDINEKIKVSCAIESTPNKFGKQFFKLYSEPFIGRIGFSIGESYRMNSWFGVYLSLQSVPVQIEGGLVCRLGRTSIFYTYSKTDFLPASKKGLLLWRGRP